MSQAISLCASSEGETENRLTLESGPVFRAESQPTEPRVQPRLGRFLASSLVSFTREAARR